MADVFDHIYKIYARNTLAICVKQIMSRTAVDFDVHIEWRIYLVDVVNELGVNFCVISRREEIRSGYLMRTLRMVLTDDEDFY